LFDRLARAASLAPSWRLHGLLLALPAIAACQKEAVHAAPQQAQPVAVVVAAVEKRDVPIYSEFVAQTQANTTVDLRARVAGILVKTSFVEGGPVKKDQVLFEIDPREYQALVQAAKGQLAMSEAQLAFAREQVDTLRAKAQLAEERARLVKAQQDTARLKPLAAKDAVPQQDLDTAVAAEAVAMAAVQASEASLTNTELRERTAIETGTAAVAMAKAALVRAELDLEFTTIRAPFDGTIGRLAVNVGNLVGRGESTLLATVSTSDPLYVNLAISEADYLMVTKRMVAAGETVPDPEKSKGRFELLLADGTLHPHKGDFGLIERELDARTGTLTLRTVFPNPGGILRPGQFGRIRVVVEERKGAVLVPQRAIVTQQDARSVWIVGDGKAALRPVKLGERAESFYVVLEGLEGGEKVVVDGMQKLRQGAPVTITQPAAANPAKEDGKPAGGGR
jgi:membrane fusion protein (multidrug efflux system)